MSSDVVNGSEAVLLEILWIRSSDNFTVPLHFVKGAYNIYICYKLYTVLHCCCRHTDVYKLLWDLVFSGNPRHKRY